MSAFKQVITEASNILVSELDWLTTAYGKAEKLNVNRNNRKHQYPAIQQAGRLEYDSLEPAEILKNYSFFWSDQLEAPRDFRRGRNTAFTSDYSLIFWFDNRSITVSEQAVRDQIIDLLTNRFFMRAGSFRVTGYDVEPSRIFRDFTFGSFEKQLVLKPYAGIRVNGTLKTNPCFDGTYMT